jgi:murein DD-endopeptidase MepM/ murein hydrolase activator NlpD
MNAIIFSTRDCKIRQFNLSHPLTLGIIGILALGLLGGSFAAGLTLGQHNLYRTALLAPAEALRSERQQISVLRAQMQDRVDALAMRLGTVNANLIRLNALGKQLTQMANISAREFDFDHDPPQGGSESDGVGRAADVADVTAMMETLSRRIDARNEQFDSLESVILGRQLSAQIKPTGRPVREGYISSYFGERMDPFNGEEAMHKGIDFATPAGTDVLAVASGIVTWAGPREGYGTLIEINHGNGYVTRYAHNADTLVRVGATVERGQAIALVGSTGRSTGPHVHFEVLRGGVKIDPMAFVGH